MELVKQIKQSKKLNFNQLFEYNHMVQPYEPQLREFIQIIYHDLTMYYSTYLRNIACYVHTMIHDVSRMLECENKINMIRQNLEVTMLQPIHNKLKDFIRFKNLEFIKIVTLYFMLNIPMIIHLYSEKIDKLHCLMNKQKRLLE
jgi:hypothetical protein